MKYRPTVLNVCAGLFFVYLIVRCIVHPEILEGWRIVAVAGMAGLVAAALVADFILQRIVKNRKLLNAIGAVIVVIVIMLLL